MIFKVESYTILDIATSKEKKEEFKGAIEAYSDSPAALKTVLHAQISCKLSSESPITADRQVESALNNWPL